MTRPSGTATVDAWSDAQNAKFQVVESNDSSMPVGFKILAPESGTKLAIAPGNDKCFLLSREQYLSLTKKRLETSGVRLLEGVKVEKVLDEDGGKLLGVPVRHYRLRVSFKFENEAKRSTMVIDEELWTAASLPEPPPVLNLMFTQSTGFEEVDRTMEFSELKGFRLKRTVSLTIDDRFIGQSVVEVKKLREEPVPASVFAIPTGCSQFGDK